MNSKAEKILTAAILLLIVFIWGHSMMPADMSASESGAVGGFLAPLLELFVGKGAVTDHLVRKLAHFAEFSALGALSMALAAVRDKTDLENIVNIGLRGLAAAVIDEAIQLFVDGRSGEVQDILLDMGGIVFGIICVAVLSLLLKKIET